MLPTTTHRLREIPYNYTSFSDREIVLRILGEDAWRMLNDLRDSRKTGQSARMLFEVLGDIWVVQRNPFIQDDLISNKKRAKNLIDALYHRLKQVEGRINNNATAAQLFRRANDAVLLFERDLMAVAKLRQHSALRLQKATKAENVDFGGLARVAHATDATDWRIEYPFVVIHPDTEAEVAAIVAACIELKLTIVPRGGGTGYTGGAIPLYRDTVVINTEKLDQLQPIVSRVLLGHSEKTPTIRVGAGTVTRRVSDAAKLSGLVFAVDPTSQDACTIGGNVAMNAGGKKAVLWGTTLDNLVSWTMVTPRASVLHVERVGHNLGKIHEDAEVSFQINEYAQDGVTALGAPRLLTFPGASMRRAGLGKDVTSKFLNGLPGIQKEGCDGLITSAEFILHTMPEQTRTVCMEFYSRDLATAVPAIEEVIAYIDGLPSVQLAGLEHLDDRYIKAVGYSPKAAKGRLPKMLLLADIVGNDAELVTQAAQEVVRIVGRREAEGFVAISEEARALFWADRSRTAAIAAHTNAFKINEDVVIPLAKFAEYSAGIERLNIAQSINNKLNMLGELQAYIETEHRAPECSEAAAIDARQRATAIKLLGDVQTRWRALLDGLDQPLSELSDMLTEKERARLSLSSLVVQGFLCQALRVSWRREVERPLKKLYGGDQGHAVVAQIDRIHAQWRPSRLFVALHAHAGDGNVHSNIPVNSHDYVMLHEAELLVDDIMTLARSLDGVVSGEHGIGLTKIQYLDEREVQDFARYKEEIDPHAVFNRGKLLPNSGLANAYTPSFRLLKQESLILEQSELGQLNDSIKDCLRCGKCKPVCSTHVPRANLLYSPRNKILATGSLIEAFLYEEQTRRGLSIRHFDEMNDVADHCTVCHRCVSPCPVNIDFGDVTVHMRKILKSRGQRRQSLATALSMWFLNAKDPRTISLLRKGIVGLGYRAQRTAVALAQRLPMRTKVREEPPPTKGTASIPAQVIHFVDRRLPGKKMLPPKPMRNILGIDDPAYVPILRDPHCTDADADAVFYFPGCGSERLFSQVGLATLAMLYDSGAQTVLPPGYLCCGYPQTSSGDHERGQKITTENRVLFHRIANTLNYLDIKTVIVSCGTCMDQLLGYEFEQIFPGCRLLDIHEYLMEKEYKLDEVQGQRYYYHDPCHTPMKTYAPLSVAKALTGAQTQLSDRCCAEAGTFAVSRPDIATQVRFRKAEELRKDFAQGDQALPAKLLTSCPACLQGLARYADETGVSADYIVVELARAQLGDQWAHNFAQTVRAEGLERVLL